MAKVPVSISLDADLLTRARRVIPNLSAHIEELLRREMGDSFFSPIILLEKRVSEMRGEVLQDIARKQAMLEELHSQLNEAYEKISRDLQVMISKYKTAAQEVQAKEQERLRQRQEFLNKLKEQLKDTPLWEKIQNAQSVEDLMPLVDEVRNATGRRVGALELVALKKGG